MHQLHPHHWNSVPDKTHAFAGGVGGAIAVIVMVIVIAILLVGTKGPALVKCGGHNGYIIMLL